MYEVIDLESLQMDTEVLDKILWNLHKVTLRKNLASGHYGDLN